MMRGWTVVSNDSSFSQLIRIVPLPLPVFCDIPPASIGLRRFKMGEAGCAASERAFQCLKTRREKLIKRILTAFALAASAGFVPQTSAQTFSPDGPFTLTSIGTMFISKGTAVSCGFNGTGSVSGSMASVDSMMPTGVCGLVFMGMPYVVSSTSPTSITLNGVVISGIIGGTCAGTLTGDYNQSTGIITFRQATIPSISGGNPCRISGRIQFSPVVTFTIP
jgi:hypothetical protein